MTDFYKRFSQSKRSSQFQIFTLLKNSSKLKRFLLFQIYLLKSSSILQRIFFLIIFTFIFTQKIICQEQLSALNTSWSYVLPGSVNAAPVFTSYGFCLQTDAKMLQAFSSKGTLLWEKSFSRSKDTSIYSLSDDFILFSENPTNKIKLINPSGITLWEKTLPSKMILPPQTGRDGRFFIFLQSQILCFTMKGSLRWTYQISVDSSLPSLEFSDGSILLFSGEKEGKTRGLHISPFGDAIEEITFSGLVTSAKSYQEGILLSFSDGSMGVMDIGEMGLAENKWVMDSKKKNSLICISQSKKDALLLEEKEQSTIVYEINANGFLSEILYIKDFSVQKIKQINYSSEGLFLCDEKNAFLFSKNANIKWEAKMPKKEKDSNGINYNEIFFLDDGYLVFCDKNWSIKAFRVFPGSKDKKEIKNIDYLSYYNIDMSPYNLIYTSVFDKEISNEKIISMIKSYDHAFENKESRNFIENFTNQWEVKITSELFSAAHAYYKSLTTSEFGTRKEKSIFETDEKGFELILQEICLLGTKDSSHYIAEILEKTNNKTYISALLKGVFQDGYDPEQKILSSLQSLAKRTDYKSTSTITQVCDAVYAICLFMGKPAYNSMGREILKNFMYPSYKSQTRDYARKTLQKIVELDL